MSDKKNYEECGCKTVIKTSEKVKKGKSKKTLSPANNQALADAYVRLAAFRQHDGTCCECGSDMAEGLSVGMDDEIKVRMRKDAEVERELSKKAKTASKKSGNGISGLMFALAPEAKKKEINKASKKKIPVL